MTKAINRKMNLDNMAAYEKREPMDAPTRWGCIGIAAATLAFWFIVGNATYSCVKKHYQKPAPAVEQQKPAPVIEQKAPEQKYQKNNNYNEAVPAEMFRMDWDYKGKAC